MKILGAIGIVGAIVMIFAGIDMAQIESVAGNTIAEAFYNAMGRGFIGLGIFCITLIGVVAFKESSHEAIYSATHLTLTDKGQEAALDSSSSASIGERGARILETIAHNPGISVKEVNQRTSTDILDIKNLVDAGLLKKG